MFNSPEFGEIRTVEIDGEPWFVGKDVATALGYSDTSDALKRHVDDEDKLTRCFTDSGQSREMYIINESGVYSLIFSSKLEKAKAFKRWVTSEVLPAIRRHGAYAAPGAAPASVDAAALQTFTAAMDTLTTAVQSLTRRMDGLEGQNAMRALPPGNEGINSAPGVAARRRWMRTVSEKLDLLTAKYGKPNNAILHKIYQDIESVFGIVLADERYQVMEEFGLEECSVLTAIFYSEELRDYFQQYVDYNLAPENRGW